MRVGLTAQGRALRAQAAGIPGCIAEAVGLKQADMAGLQAQLATLRDRLLAQAR